MPQSLTDQIEQFIRYVYLYFWYKNLERMNHELSAVARDSGTDNETNFKSKQTKELLKLMRIQNRFALRIRREGRKLAKALEEAGHNSTGILHVVHCADGGGAHARLAPIWGEIKAGLQRIVLKSSVSGDTAKADTKTSSIDNLRHCEMLAHLSYKAVLEETQDLQEAPDTDQEFYDHITNKGLKHDPYDTTNPIPTFLTWTRHLRAARAYYGEQKNQSRSGRKGRSIGQSKRDLASKADRTGFF